MLTKRSLYQCSNARVRGPKLVCEKEHKFPIVASSILVLARGAPLELSCCQECPDYDEMGPPVAKEDRGWGKGPIKNQGKT